MHNSIQDGAEKPAPSSPIRPAEWLLTFSLLLIIGSLFAIAKIHTLWFETALASEVVDVTIEGWVAKPGVYSVHIGIPLSEVLRKASPKPLADLKGIAPGARVTTPLNLRIEQIVELTLHLKGAVIELGPLKVPPGTRVCDLKQYKSLDADPAFFRKRRRLKDGEVVTVPHMPGHLQSP